MTLFDRAGSAAGRATHLPLSGSVKLAYRNILRHGGRTATTLAAIAFGVAALVLSQGFVEDIFVQLAEALVHSQTGHIQLAGKDYFDHGAHRPLKFLLPDTDGDKAAITALNGVDDVMGRLNFPGLLNNGRADVAVLAEGVEPAKEARLGSFVRFSAGRGLEGGDHYHVVVGHGVARSLNVRPGDNVTLLVSTGDGAMNTADLQVVGVFQSFSKEYDNRSVKLPLPAAQELLTTRGANVLVVSLRNTEDTERIAGLLRERAAQRNQEVKTWSDLSDFHPKTVQLYNRQFGGLQLIILLMVLLSVVNSVNMTVFERTAEFGTARALGNRNRDIFQLVMLENALIGIVGSVLGAIIGLVAGQAHLPLRHPDAAATQCGPELHRLRSRHTARLARGGRHRLRCDRSCRRRSRAAGGADPGRVGAAAGHVGLREQDPGRHRSSLARRIPAENAGKAGAVKISHGRLRPSRSGALWVNAESRRGTGMHPGRPPTTVRAVRHTAVQEMRWRRAATRAPKGWRRMPERALVHKPNPRARTDRNVAPGLQRASTEERLGAHGPALCLRLPSDSQSPATPLPFGYHFPLPGMERTFTSK